MHCIVATSPSTRQFQLVRIGTGVGEGGGVDVGGRGVGLAAVVGPGVAVGLGGEVVLGAGVSVATGVLLQHPSRISVCVGQSTQTSTPAQFWVEAVPEVQ